MLPQLIWSVLVQRLACVHKASIIFLLPQLLYFLFWNNYRFIRSCKNDTERSPAPFIQFPPMVTSYITTDNSKTRKLTCTRYVYSSMPFYHMQLHVTTSAVEVHDCCITTRISLMMTHFKIGMDTTAKDHSIFRKLPTWRVEARTSKRKMFQRKQLILRTEETLRTHSE